MGSSGFAPGGSGAAVFPPAVDPSLVHVRSYERVRYGHQEWVNSYDRKGRAVAPHKPAGFWSSFQKFFGISPAYAQEAEPESPEPDPAETRRSESEPASARETLKREDPELYYAPFPEDLARWRRNTYSRNLDYLRMVDPTNQYLTYVASPGWVPRPQDIEAVRFEIAEKDDAFATIWRMLNENSVGKQPLALRRGNEEDDLQAPGYKEMKYI